MRHIFLLIGLSGLLTACIQAPVKTGAIIDPPAAFSAKTIVLGSQSWNDTFNDTDLSDLLGIALNDNHTLQALNHRILQSETLVLKAEAPKAVQVTGSASGSRQISKAGGTATFKDNLTAGLNLKVDPDLWGDLDLKSQRALGDVTIAKISLKAYKLTLTADIVSLWYQAAEQQQQTLVLKEQLQTNVDFYELIKYRFRAGQSTALDLTQQQQAIESLKSEVFLAQEAEALTTHKLAILSGQEPASFVLPKHIKVPTDLEVTLSITPAELVVQRPELQIALQKIKQADVALALAINDRLPKISLSTDLLSVNTPMSGLFDSWIVALGSNLLAPLVDGGLRKAEVTRNEEIIKALSHEYASAVLKAVSDVEDALVSVQYKTDYLAGKEKQIDLSNTILSQLRDRYKLGGVDFLRVLTALSTHQNLSRSVVTARFGLIQSRIQLLRAMAGAVTYEKS